MKVALEPAPLPGRRRAGEGRPAKPKGPSAVLDLQCSAVNRAVTALMRVESEVSDPLYLATRNKTGGQTRGDHVTGRHLQNWAIASGSERIRSVWAIKRLQADPGSEASVVADIYVHLLDRLWGTARDPESDVPEPDQFEGSVNARGAAVYELGRVWRPIADYLERRLTQVFQESLFAAIRRTPASATLVTESQRIADVRGHKHGHTAKADRWSDDIKVGSTWNHMVIDDIWMSSEGAGGTIWFHFDDQPSGSMSAPPTSATSTSSSPRPYMTWLSPRDSRRRCGR